MALLEKFLVVNEQSVDDAILNELIGDIECELQSSGFGLAIDVLTDDTYGLSDDEYDNVDY